MDRQHLPNHLRSTLGICLTWGLKPWPSFPTTFFNRKYDPSAPPISTLICIYTGWWLKRLVFEDNLVIKRSIIIRKFEIRLSNPLHYHTWNDLWFFQNFQDKPRNFSGVFIKTFPQTPCLFFFWNRPLIEG